MNVLSLFDGMSCGQIALERAGIKVDNYYASEINKNSIKVTQKNYPNTIQIGDVREVKDKHLESANIGLLMGGSPCFPKGQKIISYNGLKNIEEVKRGELVLTHKGRYKKVVTPMRRIYSGELYKIRPTYYNFEIEATDEHPFYTQRGWVQAKELTVNDYLSMPLNKESLIPNQITYKKIINQYISETATTNLPLDKECFWKLIGYWLAEGWTRDKRNGKNSRNTYRIFLAVTDKKSKFIIPVLKSLGIHYRIEKYKTCNKITFGSKEYWMFVKKFTNGTRASEKFIPEFVQNLPINLAKSFVDGYKNGDGEDNDEKIRYSSTSKTLLEGLQRLLLKTEKKLYSLSQSDYERICTIEGREVNALASYALYKKKTDNKYAYFTNDYVFYKLRKINKESIKNLDVYNFEVEEDNSYCLPITAVHNCQNLSRSVINNIKHNQGLKGEKSSLFYEYVRVLEITKPQYFLFENVESMKNEDRDIITETLNVEPVMINSALVSAQDRKRYYWTNIPNVTQPNDKNLFLRDIVQNKDDVEDKYWYEQEFTYHGEEKRPVVTLHINGHDILKRVYGLDQKSPTLTACRGGNLQKKVFQNGKPRKLTPLEYERLQTVPEGYTEGVADSHRYNMLGDGWTVDVIAHILKGLK
ncbi:DNA cytosine methyltransferase [Paraliobacillus ryukyuensis]|uniref:DNA cytosine methyltransferase n=1 Tax=Paraliobacillus ryukyuensis TaxID=200904 RepID=UPI0009A88025|nr:DNA cytosine methyltransferase [Paraliobacillus ryukyuensis]